MNQTSIDDLHLNSTLTLPGQNQLEYTIQYVYMIVYPIIFIIGLVGNLISSLLFSITELGETSCAVYFLVLAISDSVALISGFHYSLTIGYHLPVSSATYCRVRNFLSYTSVDLASWMVVAISVDRFYKVKWPLRAHVYCTRKLTMIVSSVLIGLLALKNVHLATKFIGDFSINAADNCDPNPDYPGYVWFFQTVWPWIDLAVFAILPFAIVTSSNIFIIYNQYRRRLKFGYQKLDCSLIKLLLISSISFILCNFPISIAIVVFPYVSQHFTEKTHYDGVNFTFDLLRIPSYASLALNFYFYYYSSGIFRQQALLLFKRIFQMVISIGEFIRRTINVRNKQIEGELDTPGPNMGPTSVTFF